MDSEKRNASGHVKYINKSGSKLAMMSGKASDSEDVDIRPQSSASIQQ